MKPRTAVAVILLAALVWVAASKAAGGDPPAGPVTVPDTAPVTDTAEHAASWVSGLVDAVKGWAGWALAHPGVLLGFLAVAVAVMALRAARARMTPAQDPQRMYTAEQRAEVFGRAGGRCEYTGLFLGRCRKPAEHTDHLFPWSRGGATTLKNAVASCSRHNLSKGAKILPAWRVRLLVRRRRRYFPAGVDVSVGEKYADMLAGRVPVR